MIIQRSRLKWINDGDVNGRFFHSVMKGRLRRNHIGPLNISRGVFESVEEVRGEVYNHFGNKFKENLLNRPRFEGVSFRRLGEEERRSLEAPFVEEEIKEAIWCCDGAKSPGSDGF